MHDAASSGQDRPLTYIGRLSSSVRNRQLSRFLIELVLVVTGILIALAIDGWVSDAHDRNTELGYLENLARDIKDIRQLAEAHIKFEKHMTGTGARAYEALSTADPAASRADLGPLLGDMSTRHTLILSSATYKQMVSSGHLQLIRNETLRDSLVRYFDSMERSGRIVEKNNRDLIDYVYIPFLMRAGISDTQQTVQPVARLARADTILTESLGAGFVPPEDRVLSAPPDADSWNDIRRNVLFRTQMSAVGQSMAESIIEQSDAIAAALAAELNRRNGSSAQVVDASTE